MSQVMQVLNRSVICLLLLAQIMLLQEFIVELYEQTVSLVTT